MSRAPQLCLVCNRTDGATESRAPLRAAGLAGGLEMKVIMGRLQIALGAALLAGAASISSGAAAQNQLSEETVKRLMDYAWLQTPSVYTERDGRKIQIDKKNRPAVMVPIDNARDVIVVGRRSALAQICKLNESMLRNHRSLMRRELARTTPKWTDQQLVFLNMLHLTTVQIFTGDITITVEEDGKRKIIDTDPEKKRKPTCTEDEAKKLQEQIETYVSQGPKLEDPQAPAKPVQPTVTKKP